MSICSNFALNVYLPIYLFIYLFIYFLLLIISFIAMFTCSEFRFSFVYVGEANVARTCDPTQLLLFAAIKYV